MAATIYLDLTAGNDSNDGLTVGAPKLTLLDAHDTVDDAGTVILLDGTYTLSASVKTTITKNVTFTSQGGEPTACVIDGDNSYVFAISSGSINITILISNIKYKDHVVATNWAICQNASSGSTSKGYNCIFENIDLGSTNEHIMFGYTALRPLSNLTSTIESCVFIECTNVGTWASIIAAGQSDGTANINNCIFYNATNQLKHIARQSVAGITSNFKNNIVYQNVGATTYLVSDTNGVTNFYNNDTYAASGAVALTSSGSPTVEQNNITTDPLFVDLPNLDFRLRPSSPCIDTGTIL